MRSKQGRLEVWLRWLTVLLIPDGGIQFCVHADEYSHLCYFLESHILNHL